MKNRLYRSLSVLLTASFIVSGISFPVHAAELNDDRDLFFTVDEEEEQQDINNALITGEDTFEISDGSKDRDDIDIDSYIALVSDNEADTGAFLDENNTYHEIDLDVEESQLGFSGERVSSEPWLKSDRAENIPSSFRTDASLLPPVRNQNPYGTCWSFASMALCEISMAKNYGLSANDLDFSERALTYFFYDLKGVDDPLGHTLNDYQTAILGNSANIYELGGNVMLTSFFLANWGLPIDETLAPYSELVSCNVLTTDKIKGDDALEDNLCYDPIFHVQNVRFINEGDEEGIKRAIMKNGVVARSFYSSSSYYNAANYAYNSGATHSNTTNHAITLVGWDDGFSKDKFKIKPSRDGAWLVRNSYGPGYGQDGYMWISYDDQSLNKVVMMSCEPKDNYKYNYFYDGSTNISKQYGHNMPFYVANIFTASSNEILKAVSIAMQSVDTPYSVQIYRNLEDLNDPASGTPMLKEPVKGTTSYQGIYTIPLNTEVKLNKGDTFSVVFYIESADKKRVYAEQNYQYSFLDVHADIQAGQSFMKSSSDTRWYDLADSEACLRIHAFTDEDSSPLPDPFRNLYYVVTDKDNVILRTPIREIKDTLKMDKADGYRYFISITDSGLSSDCISAYPDVVGIGGTVSAGSVKRTELIPGELGVTDVTVSVEGTDEKKKLSFRVSEPSIRLSRSVFEFNAAQDIREDTVEIRNGYFNRVEDITLDGPEGFAADYDFDLFGLKGTLTLKNTKVLKAGTYNAVLKIKLEGIEEPILKDLKIKVNNIKPALTLSTIKPVDLLYRPDYGAGELKISVNTGKITDIKLADISKNGKTAGVVNPLAYEAGSPVIDLSGKSAVLKVKTKSLNPRFNKAQLQVFIDGYANPVKKDISISYTTSTLKPSCTSATVLTGKGGVLDGNNIEFKVNNLRLKSTESFYDPVIILKDRNGASLDGRYSVEYDYDTFTIKPASGMELLPGGEEIYITVTDLVHLNACSVNRFTVKPLNIDNMSLAFSRKSITAEYYEGETDINKGLEYNTYLSIKGCGGLNDFVGDSLIISAADGRTDDAVTQGKLDAVYDKTDGRVRIFFPNGDPVAGTYKFSFKIPASLTGPTRDISSVVSVKVKKLNKIKAEKCKAGISGKLDVLNRTGSVIVKPTFNNLPSGYNVNNVVLTGTDAALFKLNAFSSDGRAALSLLDETAYRTGTKYKVGFKYTISTGGGSLVSATPVYNITVTEGKCVIMADGVDVFGTVGTKQTESLDITAYNSIGRSIGISDVILQNPNDDFSLVKKEEGYFIEYRSKGAVKRGATYTLKLKVVLKDKADNTQSRNLNYKVKVSK